MGTLTGGSPAGVLAVLGSQGAAQGPALLLLTPLTPAEGADQTWRETAKTSHLIVMSMLPSSFMLTCFPFGFLPFFSFSPFPFSALTCRKNKHRSITKNFHIVASLWKV